MAPQSSPIGILVRFSRLVSESPAPLEILPLLGEAARDYLGADGAAVLSITPKGTLELVALQQLPESLKGFQTSIDIIGQELGVQLLALCQGHFAQAHTLPLVSSGDLFGALVIFFKNRLGLSREQLELAAGLADLAAIGVGKASQYAALERSYEELQASRAILTRSEKLRALGQMASGVSHDLRNLLSPLLLQVQVLRRLVEPPRHPDDEPLGLESFREELQETLSRMEQVLWRGVELVERLRGFSRQEPEPKVERTDVNDIIEEAINLSRPRMRTQGVTCAQELGSPPEVLLQRAEFLSALLNLLVNALDVMPSGGILTIRSGARDGGTFVQVEDTGPGIAAGAESRLFEPFYTTKGEKGTGLGLAMVYAFMQRHHGTVTVESEPGKGACFTLWFPEEPA